MHGMANKLMKKIEYIVVWDDCGDPAEAYNTIDEAELKIKELILEDDIDDYYIHIYKGKDIGQIATIPDNYNDKVYAENLKVDTKKDYVVRGEYGAEVYALTVDGKDLKDAINEMLNNHDYVLDINDIDYTRIITTINNAWANKAQIREQLELIPDVREGKVKEIKAQIEEGTYKVDGEKIAFNMIRESLIDEIV